MSNKTDFRRGYSWELSLLVIASIFIANYLGHIVRALEEIAKSIGE